MKPILTLQDADIFPEAKYIDEFPADRPPRQAVKVAIFDGENKLALVGTKYRLLPGGGVEDGESLQEAVRRESLEEVGCTVGNIEEIAITDEYRLQRGRQITHFFVARLIGEKGIPQTTQADEIDLKIEWLSLQEAITRLQKEKDSISFESYNYHFNVRTHLAFLEILRKEKL